MNSYNLGQEIELWKPTKAPPPIYYLNSIPLKVITLLTLEPSFPCIFKIILSPNSVSLETIF